MMDFSGLNALTKKELAALLQEWKQNANPLRDAALARAGRKTCEDAYGKNVFIRGLIEQSSHCTQNCHYCGLRRENTHAQRYRLPQDSILRCCHMGKQLGFNSFVLQGGEDPFFTDAIMCRIVARIKEEIPGVAVTLSLGERSAASYRALWNAGADRYLLRHETANSAHFAKLHPYPQTLKRRQECLYSLKEIGFQTGAGFMVGSPWQTNATLADDLLFLQEFEPHMVGVGPFIPHGDTPLGAYPAGAFEETLRMISLVRLMLPGAMLPATTALGSIHKNGGREAGLLAGANVVMPNLTPPQFREAYSIYQGKLATGPEAAENLQKLKEQIESVGLVPNLGRGDFAGLTKKCYHSKG